VIGGIAATLARPWLEKRGYLFPKDRQGSVSHAALAVGAIFKPEMEYVIEQEKAAEVARVDDESGEPPSPEVD